MIKLSERLTHIANQVSVGEVVADIGCDHALTDIYIIEKGIAKHAIAMDVRPGPLEHAKNNVKTYNVKDKISIRLSDGLDNLKPNEADSIIISGMGGNLIRNILTRGEEVLKTVTELILSPQKEPNVVREYLYNNGFYIDREEMVKDAGKYYVIIHAINENASEKYTKHFINSKEKIVPETEEDYIYGVLLKGSKDKVFFEFINGELKKCDMAIKSIEKKGTSASLDKLKELIKSRDNILKIIEEMSD
ncbi:MAG: class I SAM-dependent methyltransferase [Lachnospiraceae bacterium]|nr:class I SAM-dependent methyltransferase [Lachnospiraceae bacterium]